MTSPTEAPERTHSQELSQAIGEASIPLDTVEPDKPIADLSPLKDVFADASIVGLGEHSHGTREVFQFKDRLFRYLVTELDHRVFALETDFSGAFAIDEYVTGGEGTARQAVCTDGVHDIWQSESLVELVEWMNSFNDGRDPDDQVRFYGIDLHFSAPTTLISYLEHVDPVVLADIVDPLDYIENNAGLFNTDIDFDKLGAAYREIADVVADRFVQNRGEYVRASSERDFERAKRDVELLAKSGEMWAAGPEYPELLKIRSETIAENVQWIMEFESVDRVAVSAHNNHVNRGHFGDGSFGEVPSMGEHLERAREMTYVSVGSSVGEETFRCFSLEEGEFMAVERPAAPNESVAGVLSRIGDGTFFTDLGSLRDDERSNEWLRTKPERLVMGARFDEEDEIMGRFETNPADEFDYLFFIPKGTPSRGIER